MPSIISLAKVALLALPTLASAAGQMGFSLGARTNPVSLLDLIISPSLGICFVDILSHLGWGR